MTTSGPGCTRAQAVGGLTLFAVLYTGGAEYGYWISGGPEAVAFFAPAGLTFATLYRAPMRSWPVVLLIVAGCEIAIVFGHGLAVGPVLGLAAANVLEPMVGVVATRRLLRDEQWHESLSALLRMMAGAALVGPAVAGVLAATTLASVGSADWLTTFRVWMIGDPLGVVIVAPFLLTVTDLRSHQLTLVNPLAHPRAEAALLGVGLAAMASVVFFANSGPVMSLCVPFLVIGAVRFGVRGAVGTSLLLAAIANAGTALGRGPFIGPDHSTNESLRRLQVFVCVSALTALVLAVEVTRQRRARADLVRSEADLRRALDRELASSEALRNAEQVRLALLRGVSHDLSAPLATVRLLGETLESQHRRLSEVQSAEITRRIRIAARQAENMVVDLLNSDRLSAGGVAVNRERLVPAVEIERIIDELDTEDRAVHLDLESGAGWFDGPQFERIVTNLVRNAVRHTPAGTNIWITTSMARNGTLDLTVADDGPGVEAAIREQVFDEYVRGDRADRVPGVGVGLHVVARFAELHGGDVELLDRPGGGSCFRVRLPSIAPDRVTTHRAESLDVNRRELAEPAPAGTVPSQ